MLVKKFEARTVNEALENILLEAEPKLKKLGYKMYFHAVQN